MKTNYILLSGIAVVLLLIIFYSFSDIEVSNQYTEGIRKFRTEKDESFRQDDESPVPEGKRGTFRGLRYFDIDMTYRVTARLTLLNDSLPLPMKTSTGEDRPMLRYAYADFELQGKTLRLLLLKSAGKGFGLKNEALFLPFADASNATLTYEAGRYLDIEPGSIKNNQIELDFNMAYNPYCAYNEDYSCPIPPPENRLEVQILAGEKRYGK